MDWARFRTLGVDLLIVGILVLVVASGFAFFPVCPDSGTCYTAVDWLTLSPGIVLTAGGVFLTVMSRWRKTNPR